MFLLIIGIVGGYSSFQYTAISAKNWLQSEPICFHDNLLLLLLSGDVELNPGPLGKQLTKRYWNLTTTTVTVPY